jgi:Flp pilus assembly protein TadG
LAVLENQNKPVPTGQRHRVSVAQRRGSIIVLSACLIIAVLGFTAFTVDLGLIVLVKQELQTAADASALAAAQELLEIQGQAATAGTPTEVQSLTVARIAAVEVAAANPNAYRTSTFLDPMTDVEFGNRTWNSTTQQWVTTWGTGPYNVVRTTARRTSATGNPLPLSFAPVIGHQNADVTEQAVAGLLTGVGFASGGGGHGPILPFAVDIDSWMALEAATEPDNWRWDEAAGTIKPGSDGIPELLMYPNGPDVTLPSGNRGTINIGRPNNSTADLRRQIRDGVTTGDLAYHGGSIDFSQGPIDFTGDPGLSAAIKSDLEAIIGEPRAIVLFTEVSGNGANAVYTCVRFVGVRVCYVKLTGPMSLKRVIVQPTALVDDWIIPGPADTSVPGTIYSKPRLLQ